VAVALVFWLDVFRRALGQPLRVNSGFRCASHNRNVGGSPSSRHIIGCAADIAKPANVNYVDFIEMAQRLSTDEWEIVEYPSQNYIHVGIPREEQGKLWNGGSARRLIFS
jgi:uncharacterized protein YcbK (DUF882 family)